MYKFFSYVNKKISHKLLTELETLYIKAFDFSILYNMKAYATSMLGSKHSDKTLQKMIERFKDKTNHPMYNKKHGKEVLALISKPGILNPMYGKKHSDITKSLMASKKNKYANGVGIFDLDNNLIEKFNNNVELGKYLSITKVTVGKYLNNDLIYNNKYRFKPIN